ncbi:hypothetical protein [Streptomyces noursei]|nr:hypothetical protein [Streptomyces noursei]
MSFHKIAPVKKRCEPAWARKKAHGRPAEKATPAHRPPRRPVGGERRG